MLKVFIWNYVFFHTWLKQKSTNILDFLCPTKYFCLIQAKSEMIFLLKISIWLFNQSEISSLILIILLNVPLHHMYIVYVLLNICEALIMYFCLSLFTSLNILVVTIEAFFFFLSSPEQHLKVLYLESRYEVWKITSILAKFCDKLIFERSNT